MSLDEAIELANRTEYGLTAGIFSEDDNEIEQFFDTHSGGRDLRQPPRRRDHRRLARYQPLRRLESERLDGTRDGWTVLRAAVHAGTEPRARPMSCGAAFRSAPSEDAANGR